MYGKTKLLNTTPDEHNLNGKDLTLPHIKAAQEMVELGMEIKNEKDFKRLSDKFIYEDPMFFIENNEDIKGFCSKEVYEKLLNLAIETLIVREVPFLLLKTKNT